MSSLQCDVHIHSTSENVFIRDTDFSGWQYFDKTASKDQEERVYAGDKSTFGQARGQIWFLRNSRPSRLKSMLKELDELILEYSVIFTKWRSSTLFQLVLQNLVIVSVELNQLGDIFKVSFDKFLVGRFQERPTDLSFTEKHLIIVFLGEILHFLSNIFLVFLFVLDREY